MKTPKLNETMKTSFDISGFHHMTWNYNQRMEEIGSFEDSYNHIMDGFLKGDDIK